MVPKCCGCGKFLKIGMGTVTRVIRCDGKPDQYFCEACVAEREEYISRKLGRPGTMKDYFSQPHTFEVV